MIEVIRSAAIVPIRVLEFTKVVKCSNLFQSKLSEFVVAISWNARRVNWK